MNESRNLSARAAYWSAHNRKKAIFGWLAFCFAARALALLWGRAAPLRLALAASKLETTARTLPGSVAPFHRRSTAKTWLDRVQRAATLHWLGGVAQLVRAAES